MRKVIDTNCLQSPTLREYLAKSAQNFAVLTDYAAMEAYKGDTLSSIYLSIDILAQHPKQVIVLKGTQIICGMSGRSAGLQRRLIDEGQTRGFTKYCEHLRAARSGDPSLQRQILELGRDATAHMDRLLSDAANLPVIFDEIAKTYTGTELQILRTGRMTTERMVGTFIRNILLLAENFFKNHPRATKPPKVSELANTFIFRFALCAYLMALRWIAAGGAANARPAKIRNDLVDVSFAAYGTYFDGLLTADRKLNDIYKEALLFLNTISAVESA